MEATTMLEEVIVFPVILGVALEVAEEVAAAGVVVEEEEGNK